MDRIPRVSVIVPTYNRADWLLEAIASVRAQSFTDYELIIADDGSTDNTAHYIGQVAAPLQYLRLPHSGRPGVVRNRALAAARGELVAFLDDDDLWPVTKLERQVALFDQQPDVGMVYGDFCFMQVDGSLSATALAPAQKRSGRILVDLIQDCFIHPSTVMARRSLVGAVGQFSEHLTAAEDYDLWLRLAYRADVGFLAEPPMMVRRHANSVSWQREQAVAEAVVWMLERTARTFHLTFRERYLLRLRRARSHTHLALLLLKQNQFQEARVHLRRALTLYPLQRRAWRTLLSGGRQQ